MAPPSLAGQRLLVVGAGRSGLAAARLALAHGAEVLITDQRPAAAFGATLDDLPGARFELGGHRRPSFLAADLIVLSPGIPPTIPELVAAMQQGVAVTGEVELASRFIAAPIVGITGTNGKSTVTSLAGAIAAATGRPTFVGGNLGTPLAEAVSTPAAGPEGIVVCELSSFQLETCDTFHPRAAVLLNVTPDHLDRYASLGDYAAAKLRLCRRLGAGDLFVWNEDDEGCRAALRDHVAGWFPSLPYSTRGRPATTELVGAQGPPARRDLGGFVDGDDLVLALLQGGQVVEERYPQSDLALVGRHNLGNALAAYLAMRGSGLASRDAVRVGARAFRPLPHRMELVGERAGVRFYDDSKGTNVAAVVASLDGFPRPFALIAGGRDKGGSYAPLAELLARAPVRAVILIGEAAERIAAAVGSLAPLHRAATMGEAVALAAGACGSGDAVILSPACSSYDMFENYGHRGRAFREAVAALG